MPRCCLRIHSGHDQSNCSACAPIVVTPVMYSVGAALSTSLSVRCQLSDEKLASLYVRIDRNQVFLLLLTPLLPFTPPLPLPTKTFPHLPLFPPCSTDIRQSQYSIPSFRTTPLLHLTLPLPLRYLSPFLRLIKKNFFSQIFPIKS